MAVKGTIKLTGVSEYMERITKAGRDIDAAVDEALLAGAELMQAEMIKYAPEDTGNLKDHIKIKHVVNGNQHLVEVGVIHDAAYTDAETARYANAQEYGTSTMPAHPYIRPGLDISKRKVRKVIRKHLQEFGIDQTGE